MISFSPVWQTQNSLPLSSTPLNEGASVSLSVVATDVGSGIIPFAPALSIRMPSSASNISELTVNGSVIDPSRYSMTGKMLTVDLTGLSLSGSLDVAIKRTGVLTYSLLHGTLPPGLRLTSGGAVSGIVGNVIGTTTQDFPFTVRVANETTLRDRAFLLRVNPVPNETTWVTSRLPFPETDDDLEVDYYPFGELRRLETKLVPLEGRDNDNDTVTIELRPTGLTGNFFEGLPPGVILRDNILRGTVSSRTTPGRYLFRLGFVGQNAQSILGEMKVLNANAITTHTPTLIEWLTHENLGTISETYPSALKATAKCGTLSVSYSLAPGSGPLPPGLTLNPATGDLQGIVGHIGGEMTYTFTIRATVGEIFSDRRFALTVANRYDTASILDIRLKLRTTDRIGLMPRYRSLIPRQAVYRSGDRQFGIQAEPFVYLIKGLRGTDVRAAMNGDGTAGPLAPDFHDKFTVLLGRHYGAVARDRTGNVIYEVIYRTILDPQALAGGFKFGTNEAIEEKVLYPQANGTTRQYIYPKSIRNARMDMTRDLKFASPNPALALVTDRDGVEGLPEWMTCRQAIDDPESVLGYFPALVLAYVAPGEAAAILNILNADSQLPPPGTQVTFDRYYSFEHITQGGTTFDGGLTTFDGDTTLFDVS